jgi:hypothetical protein
LRLCCVGPCCEANTGLARLMFRDLWHEGLTNEYT